MILRAICAVTSALVLGLAMTGCKADKDAEQSQNQGNSSSVESIRESNEKSVKDILSEISEESLDDSAFFGDEKFSENCSKLYGLEAQKLADGGLIFSSSAADEISVLKLKNGGSAENYFNERLKSRRITFENYSPEEVSKFDNAKIFKSGDYWVLIISDDSEKLKEKIESLI